jgi:hypothetical protein
MQTQVKGANIKKLRITITFFFGKSLNVVEFQDLPIPTRESAGGCRLNHLKHNEFYLIPLYFMEMDTE